MSFKETVIGTIPNEWDIFSVNEISKVIDSLHQTPTYSDSGIPMVRVTDIKQDGLDLAKCLKVSDEIYELFTRNHKPRLGDILISRVGTYGVFSVVKTTEKFCLGQNTAIISPNISSKYLFYTFIDKRTSHQIDNIAVGSTQKTISLKSIKSLKIPVCAENEQKAIANTLSCLDDKIELNNRINKTLEEMAHVIFKSWFMDFEPFQDGEFEDSELGRIPKGWRVDSVGNCTSLVTRGIAPKYVDISDQYVINQKCIRDGSLSTVLSRRHCSVVKKEKKLQFGDILVNSTGVGTLGRVAQVYENLDNFTVDSHVTIVRPNTSNRKSYLGCLLKNMQTKFEHAGTGSTGQTELGREAINQILIFVPFDSVLEEFSRIYNSIYKKIVHGQKENILLSNMRDSLLPKLMSGEIRVPIEEVQ